MLFPEHLNGAAVMMDTVLSVCLPSARRDNHTTYRV